MPNDQNQIIKMKIGDVFDIVENAMTHQWSQPEDAPQRLLATPILLGPPGCAKTEGLKAVARRVAAKLGKKLLLNVVLIADREVPDIRGMPLPVKDADGVWERLVYTQSALMPPPEMLAEFDVCLTYLDEVSAPPDWQKAIAALVNDYEIGRDKLNPSKFFVVAAGNSTEHRAGASRLLSIIVNRCGVYHVEPDITPVLAFLATENSLMPPIGSAFIENHPELFVNTMIPADANTPFCTVRIFHYALRGMAVAFGKAGDASEIDVLDHVLTPGEKGNLGKATAYLAAHVGAGVAQAFMEFATVAHRLTPKAEIIANPHTARLPASDDLGTWYAQTLYCAYWTTSDKVAEKMLTYLDRCPRQDLIPPTLARMNANLKQATGRVIFNVKGFSELATKYPGLMMAAFS